MSVKTISWNAPFGAADSAYKNSKNSVCNFKTDLQNTGSYSSFKGLAAVPIAAGTASGIEAASTMGTAGTIGAAGIFGALGTAITAGLVSCASNLKSNMQELPKMAGKNAPKLLYTI